VGTLVADSKDWFAWSRVRSNFSGPASQLPDRRRVTDGIRLVVGVVILLLLLAHHNHESQTEKEAFQAIHDLPQGIASAVHLFYGLGALWALALIVIAAFLSERRLLARDLLVAGVVTWAIARLIIALVGGASLARAVNVIVTARVYPLEFPGTRVAIVAAVVSAGAPYLSRPVRRLGQTLVLFMFLSGMYLGTSSLNDVAASVVLGWTVAAAVHLAFGSPAGRPTTRQVRTAPLLVTRPPNADAPLAAVDPAIVTDDLLTRLWGHVHQLHAAHVVHGRLNAHHVMVGSAGVALVDFDHASGETTTAPRRAADVAELLASTSQIVGNERAVAGALAGVGGDQLVAALPLLQPAGLSREIRPTSRHGRRQAFAKHLAELRSSAASALDTTVPPLQDMYRVKASNLLMAVGTLFGLVALFSQVGSPSQLWNTVSGAQIVWLVAALAGTLLNTVPSAVGLMGASTIRLPLIRTTELQLSMAFANLAVPAVGGTASQVRFLQRQGMELPAAVATGPFLSSLGGTVAQLLLLGVAISLAPKSYTPAHIDIGKIATVALIALVAAVAIVGVMLGVPRVRKHVLPPTRTALSAVWSVLRSPYRLVLLLGANILVALMTAAVYEACLAAFGASANFWTVLSLIIVITTIAALVPIPGGATAVTSVGMSGALAAAGVPTEAAVAAALVNQVVVSYLPALPGWFATKDLLRAQYL
jgi:uncharacterized membrane protein YbhN (UPF0104 family)